MVLMNDRAPARLIRLPNDRRAAVITFDVRGGYGAHRVDNRPRLSIFADGTVRVVSGSAVIPPIEAKLSGEELQGLLRFAIDEQHFFEFDREAAQRELEAEQSKNGICLSIADGLLTVIRIRTAERDHKAE